MNAATITTNTFQVSRGGTPVIGSVSYISLSHVAIFQPSVPLALNTVYAVTLITGIQTATGTPLSANVTWTFTTTSGIPVLADGMNIYYGDLHNHTSYSDGMGLPVDAFATARANGLDFFALTDHSQLLTDPEWQDTLNRADAATVDNAFVGLRGFEYTNLKGHVNVLDTATYVSHTDPNYDTFEKFYPWIGSQATAIGIFNHPIKTPLRDWNFNDWAFNAQATSRISLRGTPPYPANQYLLSLSTGWYLGAMGSADEHEIEWGRYRFMGIIAPQLTRTAVLDALRARRTFSIDDWRFGLAMRANGYWMGAIIPPASTISFTIVVVNQDPKALLTTLMLYDNGVLVSMVAPFTTDALYTWTPTIQGTPGHFYYVKAYHDNDIASPAAYTSPVWMADTTSFNHYLPMIQNNSVP